MEEYNENLKKEANIFYNPLLKSILNPYGKVIITGSYALDLMTWRDLDIFLEVENIKQSDIYDISCRIFKAYKPIWFETKDTFLDESGCPKGYFIGFESKIINNKLWNVDIWFTSNEYIENHLTYIEHLKKKITPKNKQLILMLKRLLIKEGYYGSQIFSVDIYQSVLEDQVSTLEEFKQWLLNHRNINI
ncbi:hypothetical protein KHQ81_11570 [Mycoplasmatota bacterium]|nr:hypothetical protein KHQ81_11570 [Mycoplasmatota bacterium]